MQRALSASSIMLLPILAGAPPRVKRHDAPLDEAAQRIVDLTERFMAFVAFSSCPCAVLPVPAPEEDGAPWAVLLMGRQRCDVQVMQLAAKLSAQVQKVAKQLAEVCAAARRVTSTSKHAGIASFRIRFEFCSPSIIDVRMCGG